MGKIMEYHSNTLIDKKASIHMFEADTSSFPEHTHDFIEIIYVKRGEGVHKINGTEFKVGEGDILFINYGAKHEFECKKGYSFFNICFDPEVISDGIVTPENAFAMLQLTAFDEIRGENDNGAISFSGNSRLRIEGLLKDMLTEYTEMKKGWEDAVKSYMSLLLVFVMRKLSVEADEEAERDVWATISAYIDNNLDTDLSLATLAKRCFYNPSYFSRAFKERFNMPLTRYVAQKKAEHAIALIEDGETSPSVIAERCGFSSKSALYRAISTAKGMTFAELKESITVKKRTE